MSEHLKFKTMADVMREGVEKHGSLEAWLAHGVQRDRARLMRAGWTTQDDGETWRSPYDGSVVPFEWACDAEREWCSYFRCYPDEAPPGWRDSRELDS